MEACVQLLVQLDDPLSANATIFLHAECFLVLAIENGLFEEVIVAILESIVLNQER